jgi:hypothetical protein
MAIVDMEIVHYERFQCGFNQLLVCQPI